MASPAEEKEGFNKMAAFTYAKHKAGMGQESQKILEQQMKGMTLNKNFYA